MMSVIVAAIATAGIVIIGLTKDEYWGRAEGASRVKATIILAIGIIAGILCYISGSSARYNVRCVDSEYRRGIQIFDYLKGEGYHSYEGIRKFYPKREKKGE